MRYGNEAAERSTQIADRYSIVHAAVGAVFEASGVPAWLAIGSHVLFEAVENEIKTMSAGAWPDARPDALPNHLGDVASFSAGYFGSRALRKSDTGKALLAGFVGLAGVIWMWSLSNKHTWRAKPKG